MKSKFHGAICAEGMSKKMESKASLGDIRGFSKIVCNVLLVAAVIFAIIVIMGVVADVWPFAFGTVDTVSIGGFPVYLLRIGDSSTFIPAIPYRITFSLANAPAHASLLASALLILVLSIIGGSVIVAAILYMRFIFKELGDGMSPFSLKMVNRFFMVTVFITVYAIISNPNISTIMLAGFMWLMYYIFDHGRKLQEESDTTL